MQTIRELYKIGNGPSSSHTMGPKRAAVWFSEKNKEADRFDIYLHVYPVDYKYVGQKEEDSDTIRLRVDNARKIQLNRYKLDKIYSNSELTPKLIEKYCRLDYKSKELIEKAFKTLNLSMRGYTRVLKVARTIADLENRHNIESQDILEALQYRRLE